MREAFTDTIKQVLDIAQREARDHHQEFVGTDHLFLGVIACVDCEANHILKLEDLHPDQLRTSLMAELPVAVETPVITGDLPLSPKAQRVINSAIVKAQALRESRISTRFLLLSLLDEQHTLIRSAISGTGGDLNQLRLALVDAPGAVEK